MLKSNRILKSVYLFLCLILCFCFSGCAEKKVSTTEFAMNTVISLTVFGDNSREAMDSAIAEVRRIENLLSCHIETSEISKINKSAHIAPVEVSKETADLIKSALDMSKKTSGAFDITVKPLVDLWDITSENPRIPSDDEINRAKSLLGYENVTVDGNKVSFKKEGVQIDLGGAAKGYCADKMAEVLKGYGIKNALLDLGGNIYAMGKNEHGTPWRIGLQTPGGQRGKYFSVEELSDRTAVTSGSYERYFEKNGKIYHHIIDPKTGKPSDSGLISVTVVGKNSFEADMLSTAIFVMGADEFKKISAEFDYEKYVTVDKYNKAQTYLKNP